MGCLYQLLLCFTLHFQVVLEGGNELISLIEAGVSTGGGHPG